MSKKTKPTRTKIPTESFKYIETRIEETIKSISKNKVKNTRLLKTYGITLDEYNQKLKEQGGVCAICKLPPKNRSLCVDHLHEKDKKGKQVRGNKEAVRGLVCYFCNKYVIGALERRNQVHMVDLIVNLREYALQYRTKNDDKIVNSLISDWVYIGL